MKFNKNKILFELEHQLQTPILRELIKKTEMRFKISLEEIVTSYQKIPFSDAIPKIDINSYISYFDWHSQFSCSFYANFFEWSIFETRNDSTPWLSFSFNRNSKEFVLERLMNRKVNLHEEEFLPKISSVRSCFERIRELSEQFLPGHPRKDEIITELLFPEIRIFQPSMNQYAKIFSSISSLKKDIVWLEGAQLISPKITEAILKLLNQQEKILPQIELLSLEEQYRFKTGLLRDLHNTLYAFVKMNEEARNKNEDRLLSMIAHIQNSLKEQVEHLHQTHEKAFERIFLKLKSRF